MWRRIVEVRLNTKCIRKQERKDRKSNARVANKIARVQAQGKNSGPASKARYFVKRPFS
jgi:hypothetical protein